MCPAEERKVSCQRAGRRNRGERSRVREKNGEVKATSRIQSRTQRVNQKKGSPRVRSTCRCFRKKLLWGP
eukprot:9478859-Pyramimonas_sp.AAC.1